MKLHPTPLAGAWIIEPEPIADERGSFARLFCADAFAALGLNPHLHQISMSHNRQAGVLRGLHIQRPPFAEAKLVRVTAGAIYDVIVDLRAGSPSYGRSFGLALSAAARTMIYVPEGFAHGFQTLCDDCELTYHISAPYIPVYQDGIRWDDPQLSIDWPDPAGAIISDRDRSFGGLAQFRPVALSC